VAARRSDQTQASSAGQASIKEIAAIRTLSDNRRTLGPQQLAAPFLPYFAKPGTHQWRWR